MKNINILSDVEKARLRDENLFWKRMEQLIIISIMGVLLFGGLRIYLSNYKEKVALARNRDAKIQNMINKVKVLPRKEYKNIEAQNNILNYILNNKDANVSNYIKSLENSEAKYIWIDKIQYQGDYFVIEGTSVGATDMGPEKRIYEFEDKLEKTELYKKIELIYLEDNKGSVLDGNSSNNLSVKKFEYKLFL